MIRSHRVHRPRQFGHPAQPLLDGAHGLRDAFTLRLLDHRRGTQREEPDHRAHLEPRGAAVGQPQQVVVEAILLVPHAVPPGSVDPRGDVVEVLDELEDHLLVDRVVRGELDGELQHVLAEERHPRRAVRLFEVTAGGQRRAAVEDADVVEAEEAALEHVLAEAVLAVDPPGEVQRQLVERRPEEVHVHLAAQRLLRAMEEQRREGVDRRVHVAEVPFVGGDLAVRVQVVPAEHQVHLLLGEIGIDDRDRQRVEGQVPGRVPRVLPLVGHRDDVLVEHVVPVRVAGTSVPRMQRVGVVLVEPVVAVEEEELLAPQHAGEGLTHHVGRIVTHRRRGDRLVEVVGLTQPAGKDIVEGRAERLRLSGPGRCRRAAGESPWSGRRRR